MPDEALTSRLHDAIAKLDDAQRRRLDWAWSMHTGADHAPEGWD